MVAKSHRQNQVEKPALVSRAGYKLASVTDVLGLDFRTKVLLDVGASTGGFTDLALQKGAAKVYAVDVGTRQLHPKLRTDPRVVAMEKTDIRDVRILPDAIDLVMIDVSFISIREVLPKVAKLIKSGGHIVAMVKPQFETAGNDSLLHRGVVKNNRIRRQILRDFEAWTAGRFQILAKADSKVRGSKGNLERFYILYKTK